MTAMREAIQKAKPELAAQSRLATSAWRALEKAKGKPEAAIGDFVITLTSGAQLLMALLDISEDKVRRAAMRYLRERAIDLGGASLSSSESPHGADRPSDPTESRARLSGSDSHRTDDRPDGGDRSSQNHTESQGRRDRPVAVTAHARAIPRAKTSRAVAMRFATGSIFAREIGSGKKTVGDVTRFDVVNIKRRGLIDSVIADGLLEFEWPDEQVTTLDKVASEDQVRAVFDRAYRSLDALGLSHAS